MHVFHIKGFSSILVLLLAIVAAIALFLVLPASFMMVLWNAVVFEGLKGPEIDMYQGFLLWGMVLVILKLILNPEIRFQVMKATPSDAKKKSTAALTKEAEAPVDTALTQDSIDSAAVRDASQDVIDK